MVSTYQLGALNADGERIINSNSVTRPLVYGTTRPNRGECALGQRLEYTFNSANMNGQIDSFRQGKRGDCYFLAAIYSICTPNADGTMSDEERQLMKNIKDNGDGSYTVKLPGAIEVRNYYEDNYEKDKILITGEYTITKSAVKKTKQLSGKSYAYGDLEVILLELAMEAYRGELRATRQALGLRNSQCYVAGGSTPGKHNDTLSSGDDYDAIFILTGKQSEYYYNSQKNKTDYKLYTQGEYGYVSSNGQSIKGGPLEVSYVYNRESSFQRMLDKCKGHEEEYMMTVGVYCAEDGTDGITRAGNSHALSVVKITDNYVEVVNPWDTTKHERIPRGDFENMAFRFTITPRKEPGFWESTVNWFYQIADGVASCFNF